MWWVEEMGQSLDVTVHEEKEPDVKLGSSSEKGRYVVWQFTVAKSEGYFIYLMQVDIESGHLFDISTNRMQRGIFACTQAKLHRLCNKEMTFHTSKSKCAHNNTTTAHASRLKLGGSLAWIHCPCPIPRTHFKAFW